MRTQGPKEDNLVVRCTLPLILLGLALVVTFTLAGAANARMGVRPDEAGRVSAMHRLVDHYRGLTWTYQRAANEKRTPSSLRDRRTNDVRYLQRSIDTWTSRAFLAERRAVAVIHRRLFVRLPKAPALHARLAARVSFSRRLALSLRRIYPGRVTTKFAHARASTARETLRLWQRRSAVAALVVSVHEPAIPARLHDSLLCIHRFEGSWDANTGNGYYGGLQFDRAFQSQYGREFVNRFGTADNWPVWAQLQAAVRAYESGRGFTPWPNTARVCGLL
jgi:Transglycosylase-like domain